MLNIIYNPISGKCAGKKAYNKISLYLKNKNIPFTGYKTEKQGHATEIISNLNKNNDNVDVVIIGGDGTFSEALNGINNFDTLTLGFIPCGTGNDYAKKAGIPLNPIKALEPIVNNKRKYTDFIQLENRRTLNVGGAGMDVDVLVRYANMKHFNGKLKYYASLIDVLLHLHFHKIKLTIDNKTEITNVFLVAVANGTYIGGGMPISPNSIIDDGLMDIVVVRELPKYKVFPLLIKFLSGGKHVNEPCTTCYRCKKAELEILDDGKIQTDGEVISEKILKAELIHNKLKVFG